MRKYFILYGLMVFLCPVDGFSQRNSLKNHAANVEFIGSETEGTITVSAVGFAKKRKESIHDAASDTFYTLLFRGIPGSQYKYPMINNEDEFKNNAVVIEILKGGYVSFLTRSELTNETTKKRKADGIKGIQTQNEFTINCVALRKYLEQKDIVRKFGI